MATNIPPHNLKEVLAACSLLVKRRVENKEVTDKDLLKIVPGPDFPTGATILGTDGAKQLYTTGNGGVTMRAVTSIEKVQTGKSSSRNAIIVTELPYQVNKAALLEKIAALVNEKKLEGIADLRDESDRDGIRVVLELKRDAVAAVVLNNLFAKTPLQTSFSGNFLALMEGDASKSGEAASSSLTPRRFTLREALDCFLDFRFDTIRRKSSFQLGKVQARMHIVEGLLKALTDVDQVIETIRQASDTPAAREILMDGFELSREQADAVLRLQLGQLTRLNKGKLENEQSELTEEQNQLTNLLQEDSAVYGSMLEEFSEMSSKFGTERKTKIEENYDGQVDKADMIPNSRSGKQALRTYEYHIFPRC